MCDDHAVGILEVLSDSRRREVLERGRLRSFAAGEVVFHEGDAGDTLHIVMSGLVAIRGATPLGDVTTFAVLGPGDAFGEVALVLPAQQRTASVVALQPTRTVSLHRRDVDDLRRSAPGVEDVLDQALATAVQRLSVLLLEAYYTNTEVRLARRLVELAPAFGGLADGTVIPMTQDDLAGLAGTTRQTANRILQELRDAGAVDLSRGRVIIRDAALLARRAR